MSSTRRIENPALDVDYHRRHNRSETTLDDSLLPIFSMYVTLLIDIAPLSDI